MKLAVAIHLLAGFLAGCMNMSVQFVVDSGAKIFRIVHDFDSPVIYDHRIVRKRLQGLSCDLFPTMIMESSASFMM